MEMTKTMKMLKRVDDPFIGSVHEAVDVKVASRVHRHEAGPAVYGEDGGDGGDAIMGMIGMLSWG